MTDTWDKLESTRRLSRWSAWCAVVLAFIAATAGVIEMITEAANVASIAFAFLSGISGLSAKVADRRKQTLEDAHKRTKPELDVAIKTGEPSGRLLVVIEPRNKVPFEYKWIIATQNNSVVSGIPLEWTKVIPNDETPRFSQYADFNMDKVVDDYVELRLDYRSIYAAELLMIAPYSPSSLGAPSNRVFEIFSAPTSELRRTHLRRGKRCMLVSAKPEPDISRGCAGKES